MSTVPEVIAARQMQLPCAAVSVITDECDPDNLKPQQGNDLGERMMNAFKDAFEKDCSEITSEIIIQAFEQLNQHDIAIGPAADGGYYLLGMKWLHQSLFQNIAWSTNRVLNDIDEEKDLKR
ncbi:unnamed protein product [Oppiella nova]|uniref:Glycosyltransferase n=1 Tax=Oppiella nova TaxID=334625 RepID=A0A7R9QJC2_9ACAR|nr:unnamed protein product [Oppiella nova]CAG2166998.1 unnamed protein product [Oppiella nova]